MNRRGLLAQGIGLFCVGLSGCPGSSNSDRPAGGAETTTTGGGAETTPTEDGDDGAVATTQSDEGVRVRIFSSLETTTTIEVGLSREDSEIHTERLDLPPEESVFVDYTISETGLYAVDITTESGRSGSTRVSVEEYALTHGRNIVMNVSPETIRGYIQE